MPLTNIGLALWLEQTNKGPRWHSRLAVLLLTTAAVVIRCDMVLLLGLVGMHILFTGAPTHTRAVWSYVHVYFLVPGVLMTLMHAYCVVPNNQTHGQPLCREVGPAGCHGDRHREHGGVACAHCHGGQRILAALAVARGRGPVV